LEENNQAPKTKRLSKLKREPKAVASKQLTARSFDIIRALADYRFLPTSLLLRLVEGNEDVTHRHLQMLFHRGLINRFAFPKSGGSNEFNYYLDNPEALVLLADHRLAKRDEFDAELLQRNKEKAYWKIADGDEAGGRGLFLLHELMVSRFHFMVDMACRCSSGTVELVTWKQGSALHDSVVDSESGELVPHRPDAFFTLRFPNDSAGKNRANFFYEADRKTTSVPKMLTKFRGHLEFIRQGKHQDRYNIRRVQAVLVETIDTKWAQELRRATAQLCSLPLFWFTASNTFTIAQSSASNDSERPVFQAQPDIVLKRIWSGPSDTGRLSIAEVFIGNGGRR
jgi:hypothetical protein